VPIAVEIDALSCRYGPALALDGISLRVEPGRSLALLGPSGSGKTTLLRAVAGFVAPVTGTIRLGERIVAGPGIFVPPEERRLGLVHQQYALWPHMTVREHVLYPLKLRRVPTAQREREASALLDALALRDLADKKVTRLSGGQQQRVALARALACAPEVLLLDEPTSALDAQLRDAALAAIRAARQRSGATVIFVTHDVREALALGDDLALLGNGRLLQHGPLQTVYDAPASPEAAAVLGYENRLLCQVLGREREMLHGETAGQRFTTTVTIPPENGAALLLARPADLTLAPAGTPGLRGTIATVLYQGETTRYTVRVDGLPTPLTAALPGRPAYDEGDAVAVRIDRAAAFPLPADERRQE
jgi:ABC-type Fe3+/spermidine/putrescine transport system ATPase subunit